MIVLQKESKTPLYLQLYKQLRNKIFSGKYAEQNKLPGLRTLAKDLGVSLNTVQTAYHQLEAEGFIESIPKVGYFVQKGMRRLEKPVPQEAKAEDGKVARQCGPPIAYDFQYGGIPYEYFPRRKWISYFRKVSDRASQQGVDDYPHYKGTLELRAALRDYLQVSRGVDCSVEQIIIGSGIHHQLECLCKIVEAKDIYFEEPGYDGSRNVFINNNFKLHAIPASFAGIDCSKLLNTEFSLAYITPSHQFPNGSMLPIKKRLQLLEAAEKHKAYIIEDDYDSEYRYNSLPIPSLYSIDTNERVIYTGTFSKSLLPSLRVGYMVLPQELLQRYEAYFSGYQCTVSGTDQAVLAALIQEGEYEKHQRRMCNIYRKKHDLIVQCIEKDSPHLKIYGKHAGLHMIIELPPGKSAEKIVFAARKQGIALYTTKQYWHSKKKASSNILFLGYSTLSMCDIRQSMQILKKIW